MSVYYQVLRTQIRKVLLLYTNRDRFRIRYSNSDLKKHKKMHTKISTEYGQLERACKILRACKGSESL